MSGSFGCAAQTTWDKKHRRKEHPVVIGIKGSRIFKILEIASWERSIKYRLSDG